MQLHQGGDKAAGTAAAYVSVVDHVVGDIHHPRAIRHAHLNVGPVLRDVDHLADHSDLKRQNERVDTDLGTSI